MKLIKINTDHYVIVDDSEITQACYVYKNHENVHGRGIFYLPADTNFADFNKQAKNVYVITHSTQPIGIKPITDKVVVEQDENGRPLMSAQYVEMDMSCTVKRISLQEVKELIGEVDVEKKAREEILYNDSKRDWWKQGYNQALEDNKEKKYTEEDVIRIVEKSRETGLTAEYLMLTLQSKTEWEVEIVDGKLKLK